MALLESAGAILVLIVAIILGKKIRHENVYSTAEGIPRNYFDAAICNLVVCIVPEGEVVNIARNLRGVLKPEGAAYVGFCNPLIFDVHESALDFRFPTGQPYSKNHKYKKLKKEGNYEIVEDHRPIEWYENAFGQAGFKSRLFFTPEYELNSRKINDFVIFELRK